MKWLFIVLILALIAAPALADFNPKAAESVTMRITQEGTLTTSGSVDRANLTLYIPQEGLQDITVSSNSEMVWKYANDSFGNRVVSMEWKDPPVLVTYSIVSNVIGRAKFVNPASDIGYDPRFLNETKSIKINDEIRRLAYPYEKSWENVAFLTGLVYDTVDYDISLVGARHDSEWVMENKRGVCVEHANLLTALLRASGIPARYAVGYAYSSVDQKLIGHTWVEVLGSDGRWVPFDPTWLEGGYLDATHVKTASLLDDSQVDVLSYVCKPLSQCSITWKRGTSGSDLYSDKADIISYVMDNKTSITLQSPDFPKGGYGYVKASIKPDACLINQINIQPCVNSRDNDVLEVYEKERKFFSCSSKDVYWFFRDADGKNEYTCPVSVYDQIGSVEGVGVRAQSIGMGDDVSIKGPGIVEIGERFTLTANADNDFIFYSPDFGRSRTNSWSLTATRPGEYTFYLYQDGRLAMKKVIVTEKIEFNVSIELPDRVDSGENFLVNMSIKRVEGSEDALLVSEFEGDREERTIHFLNGEKYIQLNFTATVPGRRQVSISLQGDSFNPYPVMITVIEKKNISFIDNIASSIKDFLAAIRDFFANLFGRK